MVMDSIIISPFLLLLYVTTVRVLDIAIFWIEMILSNIIIVHVHKDKRVVQKHAFNNVESWKKWINLAELLLSGIDWRNVQVLFFDVSAYRMPALRSFIRKLSPRKRNKLIYPTYSTSLVYTFLRRYALYTPCVYTRKKVSYRRLFFYLFVYTN